MRPTSARVPATVNAMTVANPVPPAAPRPSSARPAVQSSTTPHWASSEASGIRAMSSKGSTRVYANRSSTAKSSMSDAIAAAAETAAASMTSAHPYYVDYSSSSPSNTPRKARPGTAPAERAAAPVAETALTRGDSRISGAAAPGKLRPGSAFTNEVYRHVAA